MTTTSTRLAAIALLGFALSTPSLADSGASSASSAGSASLGSLSNSVTGSSKSSSPADKVAAGDYRVTEVAELADRPGMLRLQLQPMLARNDAGPIWLTLPRQALAQRALLAGDIVSAQHRPYGVEFAHGAEAARGREAFFLVLADDWFGELAPRALSL